MLQRLSDIQIHVRRWLTMWMQMTEEGKKKEPHLIMRLKDWWDYTPETFQEEIRLARRYVWVAIAVTLFNLLLILSLSAK